MASIHQSLLSLVLVFAIFTRDVKGIDFFYNMSKTELISIGTCIGQTQNPHAANSLLAVCKPPKYAELVSHYCVQKEAPLARSFDEYIFLGARDTNIYERALDCVMDNIHCISDYDRNVVMKEWEMCARGLRKTYCRNDFSAW